MQKLQTTIYSAIIASELSHVFCCVLPTIFSVLSLMVGFGMIGAVPGWMVDFHSFMHGWELPLIAFSGVVIAFGWGLDWYANKVDCHDTGCAHPPCDSQKKRAHFILKAATILFVVNVAIYGVLHRGMDISPAPVESHAHDHAH